MKWEAVVLLVCLATSGLLSVYLVTNPERARRRAIEWAGPSFGGTLLRFAVLALQVVALLRLAS